MKCVVAWLDGETGVYSFLWQRLPSGDQRPSGAQLFSLPDDAIQSLKADPRFKPHPSFTQALKETSVPALLLTLEQVSRESIDDALVGRLVPGAGSEVPWDLGPFSPAARALGAGADRRVLQMAIQYLANGGVEDSLIAAEYDWNFIQEVKRDLLKAKN